MDTCTCSFRRQRGSVRLLPRTEWVRMSGTYLANMATGQRRGCRGGVGGASVLSREARWKNSSLVEVGGAQSDLRGLGRPVDPWGWHFCTHTAWREERARSHTGVQGQPHQRRLKCGHEPRSLSCPRVACAVHISELSGHWHVCNTEPPPWKSACHGRCPHGSWWKSAC